VLSPLLGGGRGLSSSPWLDLEILRLPGMLGSKRPVFVLAARRRGFFSVVLFGGVRVVVVGGSDGGLGL
jgi:hypothetical protein